MNVERFIRFVDENNDVAYGEPPLENLFARLEGTKVQKLSGDPFTGFSKAKTQSTIRKVLCPLESTPIIVCIGLNYHSHAIEANMKPAAVPIMFTKPADALTGPYDDVEVHECAQPELDYEAELTVILARDAKNVPEDQALDYVLGYTVGNDLSARNYQKPDMSGGQFCYAKSFDGFAPIGPSVTLASAIKDPQKLKLSTTINGSVRQQSSTDDMIWSVKQIIAHLSKGTTLRKGTVIMTGTPGGVGIFMEPKGYLKHGEVAEITLEGVGSILNKMVFV